MSNHHVPPPAPAGAPSGHPTVHVLVNKPLHQQPNDKHADQAIAPAKPESGNEYTIPEPEKVPRSRRGPAWVLAGKPDKRGIRRALWWFYATWGLYKFSWIPQPRPITSYPQAIAMKKTKINSLRKYSMAIVAVITTKGGATKTTVTTWLAAVLKSIIQFQVSVFDADVGGGKVAKRYALDPTDTMSGIDAVRMITAPHGEQWIPQFEDLVPRVSADLETGVMVFHSPAGSVIHADEIQATLPAIKSTCHTLVVDSGPGLMVSVTDGLVKQSGVRLIVADINSDEDLDDISSTLDHPEYNLRTEIASVVIVISAVKWLKYNTRTQYAFAKIYGVKPEQVVLIPFNRYLARNAMSKTISASAISASALHSKRVTISALNHKTEYAWCTLAEVVSERAVAYNKKHPLRRLPSQPNHHPVSHPSTVEGSAPKIETPTGVSWTPQGVGQ